MQRCSVCMVAVIALIGLLPCVICEGDAADAAQTLTNNVGLGQPVTTYSIITSSPQQQGSTWVYAPATAGTPIVAAGQWSSDSTATTSVPPGSSSSSSMVSRGAGVTSMPGRWQRLRRHQHQYPLQPVRTPGAAAAAGAAAIMGPGGPGMPAGPSPMGPAMDPAAAQPAGTPAYIPGKGWATIIWAQPPQPGTPTLGQPGNWPGPGPQPGAAGTGSGPLPGQPGMGQGASLPGGTMPGADSGSDSNLNPLSPPTPAEMAGAGASWGSSSGGGGSWGSWAPGASSSGGSGGNWGAWGGRRNGPGWPGQASSSQPDDSDADEDSDDTPVWPWPGSPLARSPSPKPSSVTDARLSPSPSSSSSSSSMLTPPSGPTVVTGPSKTDPDRPWLSGASPFPSPRPGATVTQPGALGAARSPSPSPRDSAWGPGSSWSRGSPSPSPKPSAGAVVGPGGGAAGRSSPAPTSSSSSSGMWPGSDADEWDEGEGDSITWTFVPRPSPSVAGPVGGAVGSPGSSARPSPSPGLRPGGSPSAAATGGFVSGMQPGGGPLRASPSPKPSSSPAAAGTGGAADDADMAEPDDVTDVNLDADVTGVEDSPTGISAGSSKLVGPVRPGSGGGSSGPAPGPGMGMPVPGPDATGARSGGSNATAAGSGPGASMGPRMGPGAVSESGPRTGSNASSTAAQGRFTLGPSIPAKPGTAASSTGSRPVVPTAAPDSSLAQGPKSFLFESKGATKTMLIGCAMPFEGSDQAVVGKAVHAALKMALQELGPTLKLPVNVNLTCLNTKCLDIPAYSAMTKLVKEGAVAVVGDICSAATVAAAGVAGDKQVPLVSPASSSPQLSGMPFFARTVPSDRYQGAAAAALIIKRGIKSVGMVYEDASYGYGLAFNLIASFTRDGGVVPVVETFKKGAGDPKAAVAKMVAAKAAPTNPIQAVAVTTNNITYFTEFIRAAAAAKLDLPILGGDAIASPKTSELLKDNPSILKHVYMTAFSQGSEAFQKRFAAAAPGVVYDGNAAQGYDAMHAILRAYMAAPAPKEPRDIAQQIPMQNFTGVSGPIAFDSKGDLLPHDAVYIRMTFDPKTGDMVMGDPIDLPDF